MELGGKFWGWLFGMVLLFVGGLFFVFVLMGWAWNSWGGFGTLIFIFVVIGLVAWVMDRRSQREYFED